MALIGPVCATSTTMPASLPNAFSDVSPLVISCTNRGDAHHHPLVTMSVSPLNALSRASLVANLSTYRCYAHRQSFDTLPANLLNAFSHANSLKPSTPALPLPPSLFRHPVGHHAGQPLSHPLLTTFWHLSWHSPPSPSRHLVGQHPGHTLAHQPSRDLPPLSLGWPPLPSRHPVGHLAGHTLAYHPAGDRPYFLPSCPSQCLPHAFMQRVRRGPEHRSLLPRESAAGDPINTLYTPLPKSLFGTVCTPRNRARLNPFLSMSARPMNTLSHIGLLETFRIHRRYPRQSPPINMSASLLNTLARQSPPDRITCRHKAFTLHLFTKAMPLPATSLVMASAVCRTGPTNRHWHHGHHTGQLASRRVYLESLTSSARAVAP